MKFANKGVLICGGTRGIGLGCAKRFAQDGARVVMSGLSQAGVGAESKLRKENLDVKFIQSDIGDPQSIASLAQKSIEHLGQVDVLVNCAAVFLKQKDFLDLPLENFDTAININLRGPFLLAQAIAAHMVKADCKGSIINISSVGGTLAIPSQTGYCVSKAGLNMLTKVMAIALAPRGIRVNTVSPGAISTDMMGDLEQNPEWRKFVFARTPLGRVGQVEEVAGAVAFLAGEDSTYITGHTLFVEGGRLALNYTMTEKALF